MVSVVPVLLKVTDDKGAEHLTERLVISVFECIELQSGVPAVSRHVHNLLIAAIYT